MAAGKLALSNLLSRKIRTALTILAVGYSVALVVAVTSGYSSVEAAIYSYLAKHVGAVDAQITRRGEASGIDESLVQQVRGDPVVRSAVGRLEDQKPLLDQKGEPIPGKVAQLIGIMPDDEQVRQLDLESGPAGGRWFSGNDGDVAVVDQVAAELLKVKVGDHFQLPGINGRISVQVVGLVHKPAILAAQVQTIYMPLGTLQRFTGQENQVTRVMVQLKTGADDLAFTRRWEARLAKMDPALRFRSAAERREERERDLQGFRLLSYMGGSISMLAATFIVFSTLSMGVTERSRVLGMLRAIGAERRQIAAIVVLEGVTLAAAGVLLGVPLGWIAVKVLAIRFSDVLSAGAVLSGGGVLFGAVGSLLAAIVASLLPAWMAVRTSPLESMMPVGRQGSQRSIAICAIVGLGLALVDPLMLRLAPYEWRNVILYAHFAVGLPLVWLGFFLMAPMFVWIVERLLGRAVAFVAGVNWRLLRQQLSGSAWRSAGTAAALMVGLAILVVMQTHGNSLLLGWKLPDRFPDMFIVAPKGLDDEQIRTLEQVPGIQGDQVLPITISVPQLGSSPFAIAGALQFNATMFFGVEPHKAFQMMQLDFRLGNPEEAAALLGRGNYVVVTDEFRQLHRARTGKDLRVGADGDEIEFRRLGQQPVKFRIAGVVWSPGMDVIVSRFDLSRQLDERTAGTVFGSIDDARKYFGASRAVLFAANLKMGVDKETLMKEVNQRLAGMGLISGDVREIKYHIIVGFQRLLLIVSTVALSAIIVAALGVTNTIMASIRSRRWQLGILRSIGLTRGEMLRLILAEGALLGLVGCALGLAAGFEMTFNANRFSNVIIGYGPPIVVPWPMIGIGVGIIMAIALIASLWPAGSAARTEPLELLQSGRSAT